MTRAISVWILWQSLREIGPAIRILMLGAPPDLDAGDVLESIREVEGVRDIHHLHLWQIDEHDSSIEAHLVVTEEATGVRARVCAMLVEPFGIHHATFAVEAEICCKDALASGHALG